MKNIHLTLFMYIDESSLKSERERMEMVVSLRLSC